MEGIMVSAATGVMNSLLTKLTTLLGEEYELQEKAKRDVAFLKDELSSMNAILEKLAGTEVLDPQQKEWRNQVREMAYDIEDCIDNYMHRLHQDLDKSNGIKGFFSETIKKVKKLEACHELAEKIRELKTRIVEASQRRDRYKLDVVLDSGSTDVVPIDPRLPALYAEASSLIGTDVPRDELIKLVDDGEKSLKVVSIVGPGGLGKTTLANQVYQKVGEQFDCRAFVSVSQKPDTRKILRSILSQIGEVRTDSGDEKCLINALRDFLKDKRYFIVIDDIWSTQAWEIIKWALLENTCGSRILVTTRIAAVAKSCCSPRHDLVYEPRPLSEGDSKSLFLRRVFGSEDKCPLQLEKVSTEIIRKCGGLPLAIITMSGLLTTKSDAREEWLMVLNSIGLGLEKNSDAEEMKKILSLSYNDLPLHLRTCLLYLVSRWIAEGFVKVDGGRNLMEEGECYFNELINRSMIQPVDIRYDGRADACRMHDMILDLIISKAVEENFITSVGDQSKIRRLSPDYRGQENVIVMSSMVTAYVRSLRLFGYSVQMPSISDFHVLRVLDIETIGMLEDCNLRNIGQLFQLRYLRICCRLDSWASLASLLRNRPTPSFGTYEEGKIGLCGANTGMLHDIEGVPGRLKSVTIRSGEVINSLALELLEKATGGFSEENKIGSGGYGKVYKGVLNGKDIAVKKLHDHLAFDDVIFKNEFENLMRVQHQNIVELVAYCNETQYIYVEHNGRIVRAEMIGRVLCFEYLQNGSLAKHLYEEHRGLDWCTRYKIIKGICEGLNYLHGLEKSILHLDLKPANILLDENMVPKIADFGLSRLFGGTHTHITKNPVGTVMYMPPEYVHEGRITKKYDVFSLGVIIIQIMTGSEGCSKYWEMSPQQFIELNWKVRIEAEATSMHTSAGEDCKQVKRCIEIALKCVETEREKRPKIGDIIHKLTETETMKQKDSSNEQPGSLEKEYQEDTKKRAASGIYEVSMPFSQELESVSRQFERAVAHDEKEVRSELEAMKEERGGGGMQESRSVGGRIEMEVVHGEKELWSNKLETIKQERGGKQEAAFSKIGPWGRSAGRAHSIKVAPHRLESVTIWSADIIDAFAFSYSDHNGKKHTIGPLGGPGGKVYRIKFAPSQFLLEVSGTTGPYAWAEADVVQTLTLVTNTGNYGPFGQVGGGTPFHISIQSNDRIVGFFGHGGMFVHAIGVYVRHFEREMVQGGKEVIFGLETMQGEIGNEDEEALAKIGPWGGHGGMAYGTKVAPHRLESLTICSGVIIDSLEFSYDDLNGKQHTTGPWGCPGGNPYTIRLGPFEFLTGVSGTVGSFGSIPNVITSLMFTTNKGHSYGPLGQGGGTPFRTPVEDNGCIVGFFGRAGSCVEALGVYIRTY